MLIIGGIIVGLGFLIGLLLVTLLTPAAEVEWDIQTVDGDEKLILEEVQVGE